jgi:hypothetical protein
VPEELRSFYLTVGVTTSFQFEGDADYQLSDEIIREMQSLSPAADTNGSDADFYGRAGFLYAFMLSTYEAMIGILAYEKLRKAASQVS